MELTLNEKFYNEHFADIQLGLKPADQCTDEEMLAGAIPKIWAKAIEKEFQERLYWAQFTGTGRYPGVVRKDELINKPGDTIYINRISQLSADGDLGATHTLEGNEENLDLTRMSLVPIRKGNAVCWNLIGEKRVNFPLRNTAKELLGDWAARKVDSMIMAEARTCQKGIYSGTATSQLTLQTTDTFTAHDLKRAMIILAANKAQKVDGAAGDYVALLHPYQYFDLLNDPDWLAAVRQDPASAKLYRGYVGTWMNVDVLMTNQVLGEANEASPAVTGYHAIVFGARALAIAFGLPWTWREKLSSYGEQSGIGSDAWLDVEILNEDYILMVKSAGTSPQ